MEGMNREEIMKVRRKKPRKDRYTRRLGTLRHPLSSHSNTPTHIEERMCVGPLEEEEEEKEEKEKNEKKEEEKKKKEEREEEEKMVVGKKGECGEERKSG